MCVENTHSFVRTQYQKKNKKNNNNNLKCLNEKRLTSAPVFRPP